MKTPIWIIPVFLILCVCFLLDIWGKVEFSTKTDASRKQYVSKSTVRDPVLSPIIHKGTFSYSCNNCHQHFSSPNLEKSPSKQRGLIAEHTDINLEHGSNNLCFNCHHQENREAFVNHNGSEIPYQRSQLLCGKCHGPKLRDWKVGLHGRPNGYWDETKGKSVKVTCIACHDPHSPKFKPIAPAPGPMPARGVGINKKDNH